jgi:hypothetical protein
MDQAEIRRLRVELQHAVSSEREHAQVVQEYQRAIQDYQQTF